MKNTLADLNNYLFEQIERLNDDELDEEALDQELKKADAIVKVSEKIIAKGINLVKLRLAVKNRRRNE